MAVIPTYTRKVGPAVVTDRTAGIAERAMGDSAHQLGEIVDAFDKAQRLAQYNAGVVRLSQGLVEIKDKYKNDTDFYTIGERARKDLEDLKNGIMESTPNPQVAQILGQEFDQKSAYVFSDIKGVADKGVISDVKAKSFAAIEARSKAYLAADNEKERSHERDRIEETIQAMVQGGIITPAEGEGVRQKTHAELERAQVFADMDRVGPEIVLKLLGQGEYDLDPETKFELEREIRAEAARQQKKAAGAYDVSSPDVVATVANKIFHSTGPQITQQELDELHGEGLSSKDYEHFTEQLDQEIKKEGGIEQYTLSQIYREIEGMYPGDEKGASKAKLRVLEAVEAEKKKEEALEKRALPPERIRAIARDVLVADKQGAVKKMLNTILAGPLGQWGLEVMGVNKPLEKEGEKGAKATPQGANNVFSELPPAEDYPGQIIRDTTTGVRYKSNGVEWVEIKGGL